MDSTWLVLIALLFGAAVGTGFTLFLSAAARRGERVANVVRPTIPDGVDQVLGALESAGMVVDASGNVLRASPGALAFGLVRQGRIAVTEFDGIVQRVRRTGEPETAAVVIERKRVGETTRHFSVRVAPLGNRYLLILADDETESIRLDEVRRDFVANISHELKTPIGAVGVLADAMDSAADDPERVRSFADRLSTEAERLGKLTKEIIDLSKLQAHDALHTPVRLDVDAVVAAAVDQSSVAAAAKGVSVVTRPSKGLAVYGDEALMTVAVHNLVSNAVHYSPDGGRVGIGVRESRGFVEIAVTDQGVGIPRDDQPRVFERFYRVDDARSRHTGGTGLGLSIVKHTVENHGGEVSVWSQPGHGSTFTIRLPLAADGDLVAPDPTAR